MNTQIILSDSNGIATSWKAQDGLYCFRVPEASDLTGWGVVRLSREAAEALAGTIGATFQELDREQDKKAGGTK